MRSVRAGDRGEHDLGRRDREVVAVVLADAEEVEAELVGEHGLVDDVADDLRRAAAACPSAPTVTSPKVSSPSSKFSLRTQASTCPVPDSFPNLTAWAISTSPVIAPPTGCLNTNGTALLIGMLLDQQVPMEWAFAGPSTLKRRLGHLDARRIAAMDVEDFVAVCCEKPAIHRFPASLGRRIHELCSVLRAEYRGKGADVWASVETGDELYRRLRSLPGYGEEKARIFVALLAKRMGVRPPGWEVAAGPFADDTPRSVADIHDPASLAVVRTWKKAAKAARLDKQDRPLRA